MRAAWSLDVDSIAYASSTASCVGGFKLKMKVLVVELFGLDQVRRKLLSLPAFVGNRAGSVELLFFSDLECATMSRNNHDIALVQRNGSRPAALAGCDSLDRKSVV